MAPRRSAKRRRLSRPLPLPFTPFRRYLSIALALALSRKPRSTSKPPSHRSTNPEAIQRLKHLPSSSSSSSSEEEEEDEDDEEDGAEETVVQADFGFFDPKPGDFGGVKLLLRRFLDARPWDLAGFVDLILAQTTVGTVVKSDDEDPDGAADDDSVYAVVSALNLARYAEHKCMTELKEYILGVCEDKEMKKKLEVLLGEQARDVGLLVSQRFVNCPHQLVPPLYDALFDEVSWATEDEPTEELRNFFRLKYYLIVTKVYVNKNANQRKARLSHDSDEPIIYIEAEDGIFHELSSLSFTFKLHDEQLAPHEMKNYRETGLFMAVKAEEVPKFRKKLKSLLAET